MKPPIYVRPLTDAERVRLEDGLRSSDAFVLRRCQILLASARHERPPQIALTLGCDDQTVRTVIRRFERAGLAACLTRQSSRPHNPPMKVDAAAAEKLRALLHQSPRTFDKPTGIWTLELAAEVSVAQGVIPAQVSRETIRLALKRLGVNWKRAKRWHPEGTRSPDPEYARKKVPATV
jgi:transposase